VEEIPLRLDNFEENIEPIILQRGYDYFIEGRVSRIEAHEHGIDAEVEGSDDYIVSLFLEPSGHITYTNCNCPYDWGPFCKHQVAVFYALRELNDRGELMKIQGKRKELQDSLSVLLDRLDLDEMRVIILNIGKQYPEIAKALLAQYAALGDEIAACKKLMDEYIRKAKRDGFIERRQTDYAVKGIVIALEKVEDMLDRDDYTSAIELVLTALPTAVDILGYCDDSDGNVGRVIEDSLDTLDQAVRLGTEYLEVSEQKRLMISIIKEATNKRYDGWDDWWYDLLNICVYFAAIPELRRELERQLIILEESQKDDGDWYGKTWINNIQFAIIKRFDDPSG